MSAFPPWNVKRDGPPQPPGQDTREAVEAMAAGCDYYAAGEAAAMLRRLHAAKVEAERERDAERQSGEAARKAREAAHGEVDQLRAALSTARAEGLREAAEAIRVKIAAQSEETERWRQARNLTAANVAAARAKTLKTALSAVLALIEKEPK